MVDDPTRRPAMPGPGDAGWPVRHEGEVPHVELADWRLRIWGQVEEALELSWDGFQKLPRSVSVVDLDCADGPSLAGRRWTGVTTREILSRIRLTRQAAFVMVHGIGGYRANLSLHAFASPDALLADSCDGLPLSPEHGWPLRLVVSGRRAWKTVKWVSGLEFLNKDWPGTRELSGEDCGPPS